jgi:acyl-coenzyme A thioesterase PaaI-like protein
MNDIAQSGSTAELSHRSHALHDECFACAPIHEQGLHLQFESSGIQTTCRTEIAKAHQSYNGIVHGGILATLLDATMIQCMHNAFGGDPLTSKLDIRWRNNVQIETPLTVTACVTSRRGAYGWSHATIMQNGRVCVTARGTFKLVRSLKEQAT